MEQKLKIAGQFDIEGTVSGIAPVGNGLINDTYSGTRRTISCKGSTTTFSKMWNYSSAISNA